MNSPSTPERSHLQVIAVDQRGTGLAGRPPGGYDAATLADDLVALMDALGHQRFAVAGHETGMWIGYALAADYPDRVACLAVAEAAVPGVSPSPPPFGSTAANDRLWHFAFNRLAEVNERLVQGRKTRISGFSSPRPRRRCPAMPSGTTSTPSPPTPAPCAAASRPTARWMPPSRRTSGARNGGCPCRCWRSAGRKASARGPRTR